MTKQDKIEWTLARKDKSIDLLIFDEKTSELLATLPFKEILQLYKYFK